MGGPADTRLAVSHRLARAQAVRCVQQDGLQTCASKKGALACASHLSYSPMGRTQCCSSTGEFIFMHVLATEQHHHDAL